MAGSQFELKSFMAGKAWQQGHQAAGHIKSAVGNRDEGRCSASFSLCGQWWTLAHSLVPPMVGSSHLTETFPVRPSNIPRVFP